ncbi:S-adenosyl-methyltransferase MraW [Leptothrix cholodnii SP-6]|uniref:Ribosomal RNA small subunit methyltransferase H n=1 Tax=Leptothrix cholodnii (strain ATCC 51168 / LMG 8142 / SP-6) TaxID=395495 RepID=RSMH_LEPCP|nr:16S rRNA (cytosine(1402)-N(4))-methyltransferase RsmH [Leptothrix cholodnii]B1XY20.1 RecName: Full=Ribosomal RNA small subunit methyltransferase H; AltName: Full=16S rRNA m(4)C1402 methyltransferase; AltName: Full=rRNA (cytosine-N(4)-)-methyltransferase RsmH [Leptothrix cholodnii SP-6]ACB32789.1 S-adenosyl-methyltransferase MraW [Leptothrix cholodnii SP-6]
MITAAAVPWQHRTVLLHEAVDALVQRPAGVYLDGTYGRGGHSRLILERLDPAGRLIAIDRDPEALANARSGETRIDDPRFSIHHARFAEFESVLDEAGVGQLDGLLLDLGISSPQIDNPERGFSFRFDGPLDMRMDPTRGQSAAEFLASAPFERIKEVVRDYGEERFADAVAKAIVARREEGRPVQRTAELAALVAGAVKTRERGQDPATRTFQALRILVNAELEEVEQGLNRALARLAPGGRLAVIAFHSLEDRIVKTFIARHAREVYDRRMPYATPAPLLMRAVARIKPGEAEVAANPRARSAILRVAERTDVPLPVVVGRYA